MGDVEILTTTDAHVYELGGKLRVGDICEAALFGFSPRKGLWRSYRSSLVCRTGLVDGEVGGIWGVCGTVLGDCGRAWLLTSSVCDRYPLAFAKTYRTQVREMIKGFSMLEVVADASYTKATRLLEFAGFKLRETAPLGNGVANTYEMTNA